MRKFLSPDDTVENEGAIDIAALSVKVGAFLSERTDLHIPVGTIDRELQYVRGRLGMWEVDIMQGYNADGRIFSDPSPVIEVRPPKTAPKPLDREGREDFLEREVIRKLYGSRSLMIEETVDFAELCQILQSVLDHLDDYLSLTDDLEDVNAIMANLALVSERRYVGRLVGETMRNSLYSALYDTGEQLGEAFLGEISETMFQYTLATCKYTLELLRNSAVAFSVDSSGLDLVS